MTGRPVEITVERGRLNDYSRRETTVCVGGVPVHTVWLPLDWSDGEIVAHVLFGANIDTTRSHALHRVQTTGNAIV